MYFIGFDFISGADCIAPQRDAGTISYIDISNGVFDDLYLSKDPDEFNSADKSWNKSTLIHSTFDGQNLVGGNIPYLANEIYSIKLKRRKYGELDWITLFENVIENNQFKSTESIDKYNFRYKDYYACGRNTEYEYCIVPVTLNGTEQSYLIERTSSDFDGALISDKNRCYHIVLEPHVDTVEQNHTVSVVTTLGSKYPYIFSGSDSNYQSGSFSGVVILQDEDESFNMEKSNSYRKGFLEWLTDGNAKILKMYDGRMWMIHIDGNVSSDCSEHYDKVRVSFNWVEVGDPENQDDLYNNGLIGYSGGLE